MPIHNPAVAGATLTVAETNVFFGTSPTSWTDLDLSGTVGSNAALVLLKLYKAGAGSVAVRKNGDTDEFYTGAAGQSGGVASYEDLSGIHYVVMVATDNTGKIEWKTEAAEANCTIDIIAFIK